MFVNDVGERELKNLKKRLEQEGPGEKQHQNVRKAALNTSLSLEVRQKALQFIRTYGLQQGLILPGRMPQVRNYADVIILPSSRTKMSVYDAYRAACAEQELDPVSLPTWYRIWDNLCPDIVVQKPRSDLCVTCEKSILRLGQLNNLPEEIKKAKYEESLAHLTLVQIERENYLKVIEECRSTLPDLYFQTTFCREPNSFPGKLHFSFDYAQQISLPFNSQQVGPLYFLSGYKVGLFGVAIEPLRRFILYVVPEACGIGKGVNSVLSLLDHCLRNFGVGEQHVYLHADNCVGQNKNNFTIHFLALQGLQGRYKSANISFLPVGHTKFRPDAHFGVFKTAWNRSTANCLRDVCTVAAQSSQTTVVLVGSESGKPYIPQYNWTAFFKEKKQKQIPNIRSIHHFKLTNTEPGILSYKEWLQTEEKKLRILPSKLPSNYGSPAEVMPEGLSLARREYLFSKIRLYVAEDLMDVLCPNPNPDH